MVARTDRLQLVLEANADKLTAGVNKAAKSIEGLDKVAARSLATVETVFANFDRNLGLRLAGVAAKIDKIKVAAKSLWDAKDKLWNTFPLGGGDTTELEEAMENVVKVINY